MNERIKLLAEQAEREVYPVTCLYKDEGAPRLNTQFEQKFAELIVQDCMTMSDELKAQYLTNRKSTMDFDEKNIYAEGEAACDILKYKMKRQFGVQ